MFADPLRSQRSPLRHWRALLVCLCFCCVSRLAGAEHVPSLIAGGAAVEVPNELLPWVPWVSRGITDGLCPKMGDEEICQWPATLSLQVGAEGGEFSFETYLDADGWVRLPGSSSQWPEAVDIDAQRGVVLAKDGAPAARLTRGAHRLGGRFVWSKAPETLMIPANVGLVRLSVSGKRVEFPRREDNGALWLQAGSEAEQDASDRAEIEVFRRIDDGVPLQLTTQLLLHVSGKTRELRLAGASLAQSRPLSIASPIPARFENNDLVLHATAGEHRVTLVSLFPQPPERIELSANTPPWPSTEVWVFVADNRVRQVEVTGAPAIDAAQTNLPEDWKTYQAFLLSKDRSLAFETKRRGEPEPAPNQLKLVRNVLLDLDGGGYTVQDQLHAELSRSFRLDLAVAPLGRVAAKGRDLLVTEGPNGSSGVELRQEKNDLLAEFRIDHASRTLPAVGWQSDVSSLLTNLHLPPGWEALHVTGADAVSRTWWSEWTLWGFFYVLLVTIAVVKLMGPLPGALALVTLTITHGRGDALMALWAVLLVLLALLRLVPASWLRRVLRALWFASMITFAMVTVDFSIDEVRGAFFPTTRPPEVSSSAAGLVTEQVSVSEQSLTGTAEPEPLSESAAQTAPAAAAKGMPSQSVRKGVLSVKSKAREYRLDSLDQEVAQGDPDNVVQTGPGIPNWRWGTVELRWSGPVRADQNLHLYLLSPAVNRLLGCLRVLCVAALAILLVRKTPFGSTPGGESRAVHAPIAAARLAALVVTLFSSGALAQPRNEILDELKNRLVKAPDCESCLEVESLELRVSHHALEAKAFVHAGRTADYRVPGPVRSWVPERVIVDGKPATAMMLASDGFLRVRLETGNHSVQAAGPIAGSELVVSPGSNPHRVSVKTEGWSVDGLRDGRVENSLHLTAVERANGKSSESDQGFSGSQRLPAWLEVTRTIEMGVTWKVATEVTRKSPPGEPISVRYTLLPGEEITNQNAIVDQGQLVVALGRDDESVTYQSVIKPSAELLLTAASDRPLSEEWRVRCGALWHCDFGGVAPYVLADEGDYGPRFRPWPGEKLSVKIEKPIATPGSSRTIERVQADLTPGHRLLAGALTLTIRVSKTYTQVIQLEPNSTLQRLSIDGHDAPVRMNGSALELLLAPGKHDIVLNWHEPRPQAIVFKTPRIDLGAQAVNATLKLNLPGERWLLFTWGPSWGPKVLLWSYLLMLVAAALILVRVPKNPLRVRQWVLLGVGLTQVPIAITAAIAAWFFLFALRAGVRVERAWLKKLMQVGLALYTLFFLVCLGGAVYDGLVSNPDMLVAGSLNGNELALNWYVDRIVGAMPVATIVSLPVVVFRLLNLLWALWLASSLLGWLKWAWSEYSQGGLWVPPRPAPSRAAASTPAVTEQADLPQEPSEPPDMGS